MTRFLLDTDALIAFSKGREPAYSRIMEWMVNGDEVAVCGITIAEFYSGLSGEQAGAWDEFITSLPYWPISREAATAAGRDRYVCGRQGVTIHVADALIGAVAREQRAMVVTGNIRDFPLDDVQIFPLRPA